MLKKASITVAVVLAVLAGAGLGAQAGAPTPAKAACADMECDVGILCIDNVGGGTFCERQNNSNICKTKACDPE
jgi:hypothetical protein